MLNSQRYWDVLVVGAGHAGIEAALAAARMGVKTALISFSFEAIGRMSCNPAIGGIAKGQLVREIDALGGEMGLTADASGIHFRMLNTSKGAAMHSPRCQSDKYLYSQLMGKAIKDSVCSFIPAEASKLYFEGSKLAGLYLSDGSLLYAKKIILTAGTFLNGVIHRGKTLTPAGRIDEAPSIELAQDLKHLGIRTSRLKTGTPSRVDAKSLDYSKMEIQHQDKEPQAFSFRTQKISRPHIPCYITWTNPQSHRIILDNMSDIPLYNGQIEGIGPRYCPSIEDKVIRFSDRERHQIFVEPEGEHTDEVYLNGISSSMSENLQDQLLRTISGLENAKVFRYGYAIEYDFYPPDQLYSNMQSKLIEGLYFAGQVNGTTGYEEAAAQGLIAGINAALSVQGQAPFVPKRDEGYIGVLLDDLVTKEITEPYRMFTSRSEFRILLRHDNADNRLMAHAHRLGLISTTQFDACKSRYEKIAELSAKMDRWHKEDGLSFARFLRNPENSIDDVLKAPNLPPELKDLDLSTARSLEISIKYKGYEDRERQKAERARKDDEHKLPGHINYLALKEMRKEGREKLHRFRPATIGQARRIAGINPADIQIIEVYLRRGHWPLLEGEL